MPWPKTIIYSIGLSIAFFFYFAYFVDYVGMWAIKEIGPWLKSVRETLGQPYSRAAGYTLFFVVGVFCTTLFMAPLRFAFPSKRKLLTSTTLIVAPVLIALTPGVEISIAGMALLLQPIVGAALVIALPRSTPKVQ